jgi:hypothetical protein
MAKEDYVPVAADDWYQRRREDAEGEFFRKVADQGPRKGQGGSTRQGIYIFTASGKLLAYRNAHDPGVMRSVLQQGLKEWSKLPAAERKPGAIRVNDPGKTDARYSRSLPPGGLVLNVYTRILDKDAGGAYCAGMCNTRGGDQASRDHLWLTEAEWRGLVPPNPRKGDQAAVPNRIAQRIARFHLLDNTRGEPQSWTRNQVHNASLKLTVEQVDGKDQTVKLRLEGSVLVATAADAAKADRGYDTRLLGTIEYSLAQKKISRFDVVAVGEHWGEGPFTRGARPGRTPLGVAFELAQGDSPANHVPPQGAREIQRYWNADRD